MDAGKRIFHGTNLQGEIGSNQFEELTVELNLANDDAPYIVVREWLTGNPTHVRQILECLRGGFHNPKSQLPNANIERLILISQICVNSLQDFLNRSLPH